MRTNNLPKEGRVIDFCSFGVCFLKYRLSSSKDCSEFDLAEDVKDSLEDRDEVDIDEVVDKTFSSSLSSIL